MFFDENHKIGQNNKTRGRCCVALGSNIPSKFGGSLETLNRAISDLQTSNFKLIKCSNFYGYPSHRNFRELLDPY